LCRPSPRGRDCPVFADERRAVEDAGTWEEVLDRIENVYRLVLARRAAYARIPILTEPS